MTPAVAQTVREAGPMQRSSRGCESMQGAKARQVQAAQTGTAAVRNACRHQCTCQHQCACQNVARLPPQRRNSRPTTLAARRNGRPQLSQPPKGLGLGAASRSAPFRTRLCPDRQQRRAHSKVQQPQGVTPARASKASPAAQVLVWCSPLGGRAAAVSSACCVGSFFRRTVLRSACRARASVGGIDEWLQAHV